MSDALFLEFKSNVEQNLPGARENRASARAAIAEAHADAYALHLPCDFTNGLDYAWRTLACECPDATEEHREARLKCEVEFSVADLDIGHQWLTIIRERLTSGASADEWTGTIAPNSADFVREWLSGNQTDGSRSASWTFEILFNAISMRRDFDVCFAMVQALLAAHTTDWQLVSLGCGPLEDMLVHFGPKAVDAFVPMLISDPAFAKAIACVWISEEKIRAYWRLRIEECGIPVAVSESELGRHHLPGPHAPL